MQEAKEYDHFLVTGEVVFSVPEHENEMSAVRINAIIVGEGTTLPVRVIGKAQQALQLHFHNRTQDPKVTVHDVVIVNMLHLGRMTQEEFQKPPEGMQLTDMGMVGTFDPSETIPVVDENPYH